MNTSPNIRARPLSLYFALEPGDVILTGTPEGVILGMQDPVWLRDGDLVAVEIEGLRRLENRFRDPSRSAIG